MKKLDAFGIGVYLDETTCELHFDNDVCCEKSSVKTAGQMSHLLYNSTDVDPDSVSYVFYMNIMREADRPLFAKYGYINGITVLMPNQQDGECHKNSGHYHCVTKGHTLPFPEVYEILCGEAMFLLQESHDFHATDMHVDTSKAVLLKPGEKIVVPPFYAHCAVNIGEGPMAFGNLAAPCELDYEPIRRHHGFFTYVMKQRGHLVLLANPHYPALPLMKFMKPKENSEMGIRFETSLYEMFMKHPDRFAYLNNPEPYEAVMQDLWKEENGL